MAERASHTFRGVMLLTSANPSNVPEGLNERWNAVWRQLILPTVVLVDARQNAVIAAASATTLRRNLSGRSSRLLAFFSRVKPEILPSYQAVCASGEIS